MGWLLAPVCEELVSAALDWLAPYVLEIAETDCAFATYWEVGYFDNWGYWNDTELLC